MNSRQKLILTTLLQDYIETGSPVSSNSIAERLDIDISSATIRNEMSILEEEGYIIQPHTSAGRIPTELAYHWLIKNLKNRQLAKQDILDLENKLNNFEQADLKEIAKVLAKKSGLAVFWGFDGHSHYTGISNLLQQPEFSQHDLLRSISESMDSLDEIFAQIFKRVHSRPRAIVGQDNPFGDFCGTVVAKYRVGNKQGIIGIFGPQRMDYDQSFQLIKFLQDKINRNYK